MLLPRPVDALRYPTFGLCGPLLGLPAKRIKDCACVPAGVVSDQDIAGTKATNRRLKRG